MDTIIRKTDISDLLGEFLNLTPVGAQLKGPCPFHQGRNSFTVSPDKQIWKCFKCGKGGNALGLVMEMKKLSFAQAVKFLADRLELEVPNED